MTSQSRALNQRAHLQRQVRDFVARPFRNMSPAELIEAIREAEQDGAGADHLTALRHRAAVDFGAARGWELTLLPFSLMALITGRLRSGTSFTRRVEATFARPDFYRSEGRRFPIAIVDHLRTFDADGGRRFADHCGLQCDLPALPSWAGADARLVVWSRAETAEAMAARLRLLKC